MKKILLATTMIVATAGVAAADVTLSGSGRMGLVYGKVGSVDATQLSYRLRVNIDASKETDSGITFGGRIRLQYDNGDSDVAEAGAELSAAKLYAKYNGFTVEIGNTETAYDAAALVYASEFGFIGSTKAGYAFQSYQSFSSGPFSAAQADRVGVYVAYSADVFNARLSVVTPDQNVSFDNVAGTVDEEISVSADYTFGDLLVSAAYTASGNFVDGNDIYFLGGEYKFNDALTAGLQVNGGDDTDGGVTVTAYGRYTTGAVTFGGFIGTNDLNTNQDDIAGGLGIDYDIGGATVSGTIQRGFNDDTYADLGVNFSF